MSADRLHPLTDTEASLREREVRVKERDADMREAELRLKEREQVSAWWRNPLVVAILATALAALGNAVVAYVNGTLQRELESQRAEQARLLEVIKTGNPDKAAENIKFLLDAGLISDPTQFKRLRDFLATRPLGSGPALPSPIAYGGINGVDDAVAVSRLAVRPIALTALSVGRIQGGANLQTSCTGFLVAPDVILTAAHCSLPGEPKTFELSGSVYKIYEDPVEQRDDDPAYALLRLSESPISPPLVLSKDLPKAGERFSMVYFRGTGPQLAIEGSADCRLMELRTGLIKHGCDTGSGTSGAPVLSADGRLVIGLHFARDSTGNGEAVPASRIKSVSRYLQRLTY